MADADCETAPAVVALADFDLVCLVSPETVDVKTIKLLRRAFTHVVGVEVIEQPSSKGLELLGLSFPLVSTALLLMLPPRPP